MTITTRPELIRAIDLYHSPFPEELDFKQRFLQLLQDDRCFHRDHLPGHITGSAFIIDHTKTRTLLTHHARLNKWLQPGGHADGEENVFNVALREAEEETGLTEFTFLHPGIFDIDIHVIPARPDFPEHFHFDIRILLEASAEKEFRVTDESHDLAWIESRNIRSLTENESILRMVKKIV